MFWQDALAITIAGKTGSSFSRWLHSSPDLPAIGKQQPAACPKFAPQRIVRLHLTRPFAPAHPAGCSLQKLRR
jgi:hypothetical protein